MRRPFVTLLMLLLLGACGLDDRSTETLRVGVPALPTSWGDPYRAEGGPPAHTWSALFDGLTRMDEHGDVQPALAEQWETSDGLTWKFRLRPDVRFSNGKPMNAEAAASTFRWLMSAEGRTSLIGSRMRDVVDVRTEGESTLVLKLKAPDPILPRRLTSTYIVEPEQWGRLGPVGFSKTPVGTGPYRLEQFDTRGRRALLVANPHAWRTPKTPRLEIIELTDESVRNQALISGRIDISRVGLDEAPLMQARGLDIITPPSMQVLALALITEGRATPLDDVRVRRALNYAVDKDSLARRLLGGRAMPSGQPASRATAGYNPAVEPYPYDPARARALLREAGYPDGFPMVIEGVIGALPADSAIYQAVAWYLNQVGIKAEFRPSPYATMVRRNQTGDWQNIDAFANPWTAAPYNDLRKPLESYSCTRPNPFFCDETLAAKVASAGMQMNPEKREQAMRELSRAYHDAAVSLFLVEQIDVFGSSSRVAGMRVANRVPVYEDLTLDR